MRRELLAWVERTLGPGARVVAKRRLTGGLTSLVHELTVVQQGRRSRCVMRSWAGDNEHKDWIRRAIAEETAVLGWLEGSNIPAPRLIASTAEESEGGPALLMTRVPGRILLMPRDRERWLQQMARMLARIHQVEAAGPAFESWLDTGRLLPPPDATRPEIWRDAFALASQKTDATKSSFIHSDYQHFNLLWSRERLTGVVDWAGARLGPPDVDVGHCRLNLALLFSVQAAERFRELYEDAAERTVDPYWDVHALLSYGPDWKHFLPLQIDGRATLELDGMTSRIEEVIALALRRV